MKPTRIMLGSVFEPRSFKLDDGSAHIKHGVVEFDLKAGTVRVPEGAWTMRSLTLGMDQARAFHRQYRTNGLLMSDELALQIGP